MEKCLINSCKLHIFYSNLLIKYKKEKKVIEYNSEDLLLFPVGNLILYKIGYILYYIL